jgi:ribosomal protein S18 acetylase RimI-like enzyme
MDLQIKKATYDDIDECMELADFANKLMLSRNNPQWDCGYPTAEILREDVDKNQLIIALENEEIVGMLVIQLDKDEIYEEYDFWSPGDYISVHRVVSKRRGLGRKLLNLSIEKAKEMGVNVRIDTHVKNLNMLALIESLGFVEVGLTKQGYIDSTLAPTYELVLEKINR